VENIKDLVPAPISRQVDRLHLYEHSHRQIGFALGSGTRSEGMREGEKM
jgi:hypothetical protein